MRCGPSATSTGSAGSAVEPGYGAQNDPEHKAQTDTEQPYGQGDPRAEQEPGVHITALFVGAEQVDVILGPERIIAHAQQVAGRSEATKQLSC